MKTISIWKLQKSGEINEFLKASNKSETESSFFVCSQHVNTSTHSSTATQLKQK